MILKRFHVLFVLGLDKADIPQFVLLTFDDAVNDLNMQFFDELFKDRTNPNGCPMKV